jgi:hypothetical protein
MSNVDPRTTTCAETILFAWDMAPSIFKERLERARKTHAEFAEISVDSLATKAALGMASDCVSIRTWLGEGRIEDVMLLPSTRVIAFQIAADMCVIPRSWRAEILERA